MEDFIDFMDYIDDNDAYVYHLPRRYIRDAEDPLDGYSNVELLQRFRFSRDVLVNIILPLITQRQNEGNHRGLPVSPIIKLCIALRFYATGSFQRVLGDLMHISQSSACRIVAEVSQNLSENLADFIKFPNNKEEVKLKFYEMANFPGVIGCIDGSHIEIKNPGGVNGEIYRNRKGWFSFNIQIVCGPNGEFFDVVIRWPGSVHDARIFNNSSLKLRLEQGQLQGIILGDSAYPQSQFLFTPYQNADTPEKVRYNTAQIRTRNCIERSFRQWKQRFRCLQNTLLYKTTISLRIICATCILHNIAVNHREPLMDNRPIRPREVPNPQPQFLRRGIAIRDDFVQRYFT